MLFFAIFVSFFVPAYADTPPGPTAIADYKREQPAWLGNPNERQTRVVRELTVYVR